MCYTSASVKRCHPKGKPRGSIESPCRALVPHPAIDKGTPESLGDECVGHRDGKVSLSFSARHIV